MSYKHVKNIGRNHSARSSYGYGSKILSITVHWWGGKGQKFQNVVDWLRGYTGNRGSSAHYVVQDGLVEQIVEDSRASWHGGNNEANGTSIGIEMRPEMTAGDWETLVELCVNLERKHGSLKYYGHKDWKNTACPGDYYDRLGELVDAVNAYHKTGKVPSTTGGGSSSGGSSSSGKYESPSAKHEVGSRTMGLYDGGADVNWLQRRLPKVGYSAGAIDGYFGPSVEKAVKKFQKARKLDVDGLVGKDTLKALKAAPVVADAPKAPKPSKSSAPKFPLPKGHWYGTESSNSKNHSGYYKKDQAGIRKFQQKLKNRGWSILVDGIFGPGTNKVVGQFQAEKGLSRDYAVGIKTWEAIWEEPVT